MTSEVMLVAAATILGLMLVTWALSVVKGDASIVDLVWGLGFVLVAWAAFVTVGDPGPRRWLLVGLTSVWGLRLSAYLAWRNLGKSEDYRYRAMRSRSPASFWWKSLFTVFLLQGALMWVVSLPVQIGPVAAAAPLRWLDWAGAAAWLLGISFEAVGDLQLARFQADPANRGRVMDRGLWRYTRHPNYFGDAMVWWGLYLIALSAGAWWTVVGPALMTFLLLRVSGVALLEKTISSRRQGYDEYVRRTSAFFPWPPRD